MRKILKLMRALVYAGSVNGNFRTSCNIEKSQLCEQGSLGKVCGGKNWAKEG